MLQVIVAIAIGVSIFAVALWTVRLLSIPAPSEPDPEDVLDVAYDFKCSVCGLRLTVTAAQDGELAAPKHCREEMILV